MDATTDCAAGPARETYPFRCGHDERVDLALIMRRGCPGNQLELERWPATALPVVPAETMDLLDGMVRVIHEGFTDGRREDQGVQSRTKILRLGSGTCRDLAVLLMEAPRSMGFAARFVTGYLYDPVTDQGLQDVSLQNVDPLSGGGATDARSDIFSPGVWRTESDPINRIIAGRNVIRIAPTRTAAQALSVIGAYMSSGARYTGMDVQVEVLRKD